MFGLEWVWITKTHSLNAKNHVKHESGEMIGSIGVYFRQRGEDTAGVARWKWEKERRV
jgi:hypothetical protein